MGFEVAARTDAPSLEHWLERWNADENRPKSIGARVGMPVAVEAADDPAPGSPGESASPDSAGVSAGGRRSSLHLSVAVRGGCRRAHHRRLVVRCAHLNGSNGIGRCASRLREAAAVVTRGGLRHCKRRSFRGGAAESTHGNVASFRRLVAPIVAVGQPFSSISAVVHPQWESRSARGRRFAARVGHRTTSCDPRGTHAGNGIAECPRSRSARFFPDRPATPAQRTDLTGVLRGLRRGRVAE